MHDITILFILVQTSNFHQYIGAVLHLNSFSTFFSFAITILGKRAVIPSF
jgi:hypothetical protein